MQTYDVSRPQNVKQIFNYRLKLRVLDILLRGINLNWFVSGGTYKTVSGQDELNLKQKAKAIDTHNLIYIPPSCLWLFTIA